MVVVGWQLSRRLGLSRARSATVAVGSLIGWLTPFVLAWVLLKRQDPTASGSSPPRT